MISEQINLVIGLLIFFGLAWSLILPIVASKIIKRNNSKPYKADGWKNAKPHGTLPKDLNKKH